MKLLVKDLMFCAKKSHFLQGYEGPRYQNTKNIEHIQIFNCFETTIFYIIFSSANKKLNSQYFLCVITTWSLKAPSLGGVLNYFFYPGTKNPSL